jgi:NADPH:quinone reductase-like Zn-dependent oxidoreductase
MRVEAAVLFGTHQPYKVVDIELDKPKEREVLVELTTSGLCHSDDHLVTGDMPVPLPMVAGHDGAGVVVELGPTQPCMMAAISEGRSGAGRADCGVGLRQSVYGRASSPHWASLRGSVGNPPILLKVITK